MRAWWLTTDGSANTRGSSWSSHGWPKGATNRTGRAATRRRSATTPWSRARPAATTTRCPPRLHNASIARRNAAISTPRPAGSSSATAPLNLEPVGLTVPGAIGAAHPCQDDARGVKVHSLCVWEPTADALSAVPGQGPVHLVGRRRGRLQADRRTDKARWHALDRRPRQCHHRPPLLHPQWPLRGLLGTTSRKHRLTVISQSCLAPITIEGLDRRSWMHYCAWLLEHPEWLNLGIMPVMEAHHDVLSSCTSCCDRCFGQHINSLDTCWTR